MDTYTASASRYDTMQYARCGRSGLLLPRLSLGLWHNFGSVDDYSVYSRTAFTAFDHGVTHFDLANNYGPVYGSAEENFGRILRDGLGRYRDEIIISTKAGYDMWPGPYGNWGSRKYLLASLDQSLRHRICRYILFTPSRSRNSARGDHGGALGCRTPRQGNVCRYLELR